MALWRLIIVIVFIQQSAFGDDNNSDLEITLLNVLFRHGEKVPITAQENYPNDPNANYSYYPVDEGDMTNVGKRRMYELGKKLRKIYGNFLGEYYLPSLIYARSADVSRAQMAMQLVLAGLFPPTGEQIWDPALAWQPVSYLFLPLARDTLFFPTKCTKNVIATRAALATDKVKTILAKYKNDTEYIVNHSGKSIHTLFDVLQLYNLFDEQVAHNLTLPEWTKQVYPKVMKEMAIKNMNLHSYTKELRRYNGGYLLHEITHHIKAHIENKLHPPTRKAFIYSGHEFNIIALARTLGLYYPVYPKYGSTFIIETLKDKDKHYHVKVVLWTGNNDQVIVQPIPNCTVICPLEKFLELYDEVIPTPEEVYECRTEVLYRKKQNL